MKYLTIIYSNHSSLLKGETSTERQKKEIWRQKKTRQRQSDSENSVVISHLYVAISPYSVVISGSFCRSVATIHERALAPNQMFSLERAETIQIMTNSVDSATKRATVRQNFNVAMSFLSYCRSLVRFVALSLSHPFKTFLVLTIVLRKLARTKYMCTKLTNSV